MHMSADVLMQPEMEIQGSHQRWSIYKTQSSYKIRAESKLKYVLMKNGTGDVPAIGAVWCNKALQQIADVAADLLTNVLNYQLKHRERTKETVSLTENKEEMETYLRGILKLPNVVKLYNTQLTLVLIYCTDVLYYQTFKVCTRKKKSSKEAVLPSRLKTDNRTLLSFQMRCWIRVIPAYTTVFTLLYIHAYAHYQASFISNLAKMLLFISMHCVFNAQFSLSVSFFCNCLHKFFPWHILWAKSAYYSFVILILSIDCSILVAG